MTTDLFRSVAAVAAPKGWTPPKTVWRLTTRDDLREFEYDDVGLGWTIRCGYTFEWDGSRADVRIHTLTLSTGQHLLPLSLTDIPGEDLKGIEAVIADEVETEAALHCQALALDPADDGDYSLDVMRDKEASR
jgi:hypothetical protein